MNIERGHAALEVWRASTDLERAINKQLIAAIESANWDEAERLQQDAHKAREATNLALLEFHGVLELQRQKNGVSGS